MRIKTHVSSGCLVWAIPMTPRKGQKEGIENEEVGNKKTEPISDVIDAGSGSGRGEQFRKGAARCVEGARIAIGLMMAFCAITCNANAREHPGQNRYRVNIQMSSQVEAPLDVLREGQQAASMIFAGIHVQLMWTGETQQASKVAGCVGEPDAHDLTVEIIPHAPASFSDIALAMSLPYADSGVRIVIFYNRIEPLLRGHHATQATVLGYVLAHEIAHVLQGIARHSETGIMRARWTNNDFEQMGIRVLMFTPEDVQLIRRRLAPRDVSASCSELLGAKL